jgi:hypothetical protein
MRLRPKWSKRKKTKTVDVRRVAGGFWVVLLGMLVVLASGGCGDSGGTARETACNDGEDNDQDGQTDCQDSDCLDAPACSGEAEICDNRIDDDQDGQTDCQDSDCAAHAVCVGDEVCDNDIDDDGDGLTDCADPGCAGDAACLPETVCDDTIDGDGDGLTDCADPDCATDPACLDDEICNNDIDDDGDGDTDCDDVDCDGTPACVFGDLSCKGIRYCYACCASGDQTCVDACYAAGTAAGKAGVDAIHTCTESNCTSECSGATPEACETCVNANCILQLSECDWEPVGSGVCVDLYNCVAICPEPEQNHTGGASTCPSNPGLVCHQDCYTAADADAVVKMRAWLFCMEEQCYEPCYGPNSDSTDCQNCYMAACSAEVDACQND